MSKLKVISISGVVILLLGVILLLESTAPMRYLEASIFQENSSISEEKKNSFLSMLNRVKAKKENNNSFLKSSNKKNENISKKFLALKKLILTKKSKKGEIQKSKSIFNQTFTTNQKKSKNLSLLRKRLLSKKDKNKNFKVDNIRSRLHSLLESKKIKPIVKNTSFGDSLFSKKFRSRLFGESDRTSSTSTVSLRKSDCSLDGVKVEHGELVNFYSTRTSDRCSDHIHGRTCNNGTLSGYSEYKYIRCRKSSTNGNTTRVTNLNHLKINISQDSSSPSDRTYAPNSENIVFLKSRIISGQPVTINRLNIQVNSTNIDTIGDLNAIFDNFKLYINDRLISSVPGFISPRSLNDIGSDAYIQFTTPFDISGTSSLKIIGSINSHAETGLYVKLSLKNNDFINPQYQSTGGLISSGDISGSTIASKITVNKSRLTIVKSDNLIDGQSLIAGTNDVNMMKFILSDGSNVGDSKVTAIRIKQVISGGGSQEAPENYKISIFLDGVQQGSSKTVGHNGLTNLDNLSIIIPSGQQKEFELVVDTLEASAGSQVRFMIQSIDIENIETRDLITVEEGDIPLGDGNIDTSGEGNCSGGTSSNYLCGALFEMKGSGRLTVSDGPLIINDSNILIANSSDVEIYKLTLSADNDEIEVTDLYFKAEGSERVTFKLYNQDGQLLSSKTTSGSDINFNLTSPKILIPRNGSTTITVKVDVKNISQLSQSGKIVNLELDKTRGINGVEALSRATRVNLTETTVNISKSQDYIVYKTLIHIRNSAIQPTFILGTSISPVYRFEVTNDSAGTATFNQIAIPLIGTSGIDFDTNPGALKLVKYSSSNYAGRPQDVATDSVTSGLFKNFSEEVNGTNYYEVQLIGGYRENGSSDISSIVARILEDNTFSINNSLSNVTGNIIWSDNSNGGQAGPYMNGNQLEIPFTSTGVSK